MLLFRLISSRPSLSSNKSRYMDSSNGGSNGNDRYADRNSGSSNSWGNPGNGPSASLGKTFGNMQSVTGNDPWGTLKPSQPPDTSSWSRSMDHPQERYDRTYNERSSKPSSSSYLDASGLGNGTGRPNTFLGGQRPQDRYGSNNMSSRFDNGRF